MMTPDKPSKNCKKIKVPTYTPLEFELGIQLLTYRGGRENIANRERDVRERLQRDERGNRQGRDRVQTEVTVR